jgi:hypothetical protein
MSVSPTALKLTQPATGGPYTGSFTLTAAGGPVSFSISVPAAEQAYLSLSSLKGTIKAGESLVIAVTMIPNPTGPAPAYYNTVTVDPSGVTVVVYYPPSG